MFIARVVPIKGLTDLIRSLAVLRPLMEEPSIYERYCGNAYDRIVSFCQLRLVMDRYNTIYRELGKLSPRAPEFDLEYDGE